MLSPHSPTTALPELSGDAVLEILLHLDNSVLFSCAQVSRLFNSLAVRLILQRDSIINTEQSCQTAITSYDRQPWDVVSALLLSVHIRKIGLLRLDLSHLSRHRDLEVPLTRATRLIGRLHSLDYLCLQISNYGHGIIDDTRLGTLCHAFEDLFNTTLSKSPRTFQLAGFEGLRLHELYRFKPAASLVSVTQLLNLFKKGSNPLPCVPKDFAYTRHGKRLTVPDRGRHPEHISLSPDARTKVGSLNTFSSGSMCVFRAPFCSWTFPLLQASNLASLDFNFHDLPDDPEEARHMLSCISAALPNLEFLSIDRVSKSHLSRVFNWLSSFKKLENLCISDDFPVNALENTKVNLELPETVQIHAPLEFLIDLLEGNLGRVHVPKLAWISMLQVGLDVAALRKLLDVMQHPKVKIGTVGKGELVLLMDFHWADKDIYQATIDKLASQKSFPELVTSTVSISIPGTSEEIMLGSFDSDIKIFSRAFPSVKRIVLYPCDWHRSMESIFIDPDHPERFITEGGHPNLEVVLF